MRSASPHIPAGNSPSEIEGLDGPPCTRRAGNCRSGLLKSSALLAAELVARSRSRWRPFRAEDFSGMLETTWDTAPRGEMSTSEETWAANFIRGGWWPRAKAIPYGSKSDAPPVDRTRLLHRYRMVRRVMSRRLTSPDRSKRMLRVWFPRASRREGLYFEEWCSAISFSANHAGCYSQKGDVGITLDDTR
jgi:hypothetical protein